MPSVIWANRSVGCWAGGDRNKPAPGADVVVGCHDWGVHPCNTRPTLVVQAAARIGGVVLSSCHPGADGLPPVTCSLSSSDTKEMEIFYNANQSVLFDQFISARLSILEQASLLQSTPCTYPPAREVKVRRRGRVERGFVAWNDNVQLWNGHLICLSCGIELANLHWGLGQAFNSSAIAYFLGGVQPQIRRWEKNYKNDSTSVFAPSLEPCLIFFSLLLLPWKMRCDQWFCWLHHASAHMLSPINHLTFFKP